MDGTSRRGLVRAPRHVARPLAVAARERQHGDLGLAAAAHVVEGAPVELEPVAADDAGAAAHGDRGDDAGARVDPPEAADAAVVEDGRAVLQLADPVGVVGDSVTGRPGAGQGEELRGRAGGRATAAEGQHGQAVDARVGGPDGVLGDDEVVEELRAGDDGVLADRAAAGVDGPDVGLRPRRCRRPRRGCCGCPSRGRGAGVRSRRAAGSTTSRCAGRR